MPPPKKGAKSIEEDFSDVPSLPQLNSLIFGLALDFKDKERRAQVSAKIKDEWKAKVRTISREDIIDYGRRKLTIAEDVDVNNVKKVAQAAAEKIFEQFVHARREKKEKMDKLKEEVKAQATPDNPDPQPNVNPNEIDCFFYMPDYPLTCEEASALNSFKYALNALIYVEERPVIVEKKLGPELDRDGKPIPDSVQVVMEEELVPAANKVPDEEILKQKKLLEDLKKALKDSAKDTAIRTFVVISKDYNHRIVDPKPAEDGKVEGELSEENKGFNSVNEIAKDVYQTLDKVASNLIKYQAFKANSNFIKLKAVKQQPETESRLEDGDEQQVLEQEVAKDASKPIDKSKNQGKQPEDKSKLLDKSGVEQDKFVFESPPADETLPREWNFESYQAVVNDLPEDK